MNKFIRIINRIEKWLEGVQWDTRAPGWKPASDPAEQTRAEADERYFRPPSVDQAIYSDYAAAQFRSPLDRHHRNFPE